MLDQQTKQPPILLLQGPVLSEHIYWYKYV